jgi:hypothetical protein
MIAGLSTGCAEMEQLAKQYNPDNAKFPGLRPAVTQADRDLQQQQRADEDNAKFPGLRDMNTPCTLADRTRGVTGCWNYETPEEIAAKKTQGAKHKLVEAFVSRERIRNCRLEARSQNCESAGTDFEMYTADESKLFQWSESLTIAQVQQGLKEHEGKLLAAAKQQAIADKKEAIARVQYEKESEKERQKQNAEYWRIVNQQKAAYAAKQKAEAAALQAAIIERRDHPEIGAARDRAANKARYERMKAEEDVYRAKHNGRSEEEDQMKVLEGASKQYIDQQRLQNALKGY